MRRLLALALSLMVAGCGGGASLSSSTVPSQGGPFVEEPRVVIHTHGDARAEAVTGHTMDVSGTLPTGETYVEQDFVLKGAGLQGISRPPYGLQQFTYPYMAFLAGDSGANCIRTYGAAFDQDNSPTQLSEDTKAALEWAAAATTTSRKMFVAVGITLQRSDKLDYTNSTQVLQQRQKVLEFVDLVGRLDNSRQFGWILGNELIVSSDPAVKAAVYTEINTIAREIRKRGSQLPRLTAIQTVTPEELKTVASYCPDLDILGINDYYGSFGGQSGGGFLNTLHQAIVTSRGQSRGWTKPYIVSEFGSYDLAAADLPRVALPNTPAFTAQGYYGLEANSTAIASNYLTNYQSYIQPYLNGGGCLGSFCYVWQNPVFSSLYGYYFEMFLTGPTETPTYNPPGRFRTESVASMVSAWGGTATGGPYPQITSADGDPQAIQCAFKATAANLTPAPVSKGSSQTASVTAAYASPVTFTWYLVDDSGQHYNPQRYGGTASTSLGNGNTTSNGNAQTNTVVFNAPSTAGNYQLRVLVTDGTAPTDQNAGATAAVFFQVQ